MWIELDTGHKILRVAWFTIRSVEKLSYNDESGDFKSLVTFTNGDKLKCKQYHLAITGMIEDYYRGKGYYVRNGRCELS